MKICNYYTIYIAIILISLFGSFSYLEARTTPSEYEHQLMELINQARVNPLIAAKYLGKDPEVVKESLPQIEHILTQGLPPLVFNTRLYLAANQHNLDMLNQGYYSHNSLDGRTVKDRIRAQGYSPILSGEYLGLFRFKNFIEPETAVWRIFKSFFEQELDPETKKRYILNPNIKEIGLSFSCGSISLQGTTFNAYIANCDFATSKLNVVELEVFRLLNKSRNQPVEFLYQMGISKTELNTKLDGFEDLDQGMPPLAWNENLYQAAVNRGQETDLSNKIIDLDSDLSKKYLAQFGYNATRAKSIVLDIDNEIFEQKDVDQLASDIVTSLYNFHGNNVSQQTIPVLLNKSIHEIGVKIIHKANKRILSIFLASPYEQRSFVVGNIYKDIDGDEGFDYFEALNGTKISLDIAFNKQDYMSVAGILGNYQISLPGGIYQVELNDEGLKVVNSPYVSGMGQNVLQDLEITQ